MSSILLRSARRLATNNVKYFNELRFNLNFKIKKVAFTTNQILLQVRNKSGLPFNLGVMFVPQQEAWVVERMGKFLSILNPVFFFFFAAKLKFKI